MTQARKPEPRIGGHILADALVAQVAETERRLADAAAALRVNPAEVPERVQALLEERRRLERQVAELQRKLATGGGAAEAETVGDVTLAARNLGDVPPRELKGLADAIGKQIGSGVVALVSTAEGKASIVVGVSPDLAGRFNAVELVRAASAAVSRSEASSSARFGSRKGSAGVTCTNGAASSA